MDAVERVAGDPRINQQGWVGVDDADKATYLRWLAAASLKQFLDIVGESLKKDPDGARMWPQRRRYWTAWFDTGKIDEAWVAFGRGAQEVARRLSQTDASLRRGHAKLEKAAIRDQSALIMKLGDLTIVEWSHSGKCWIWSAGESPRPSLRRSGYDADELRGASVGIIHHPDGQRTYRGWQHEISEEVRKRTGFQLPEAAWKHSRNV